MPNGSFELYSNCPNAGSQVDYSIGWEAFSGTPDYFDSCSFPGYVSVPDNLLSYRYAADGGAYCGINTYIQGDSNYSAASREIVGRQLSTSLTIGQKYYVSFKVNLVLNSDMGVNLATNKLGMLFSTVPYGNTDSSTIPPINNFAHIYSDSVISDTLNWTTISGSFIADSTYNYISIGAFFKYEKMNIVAPISTIWVPSAYYFVDDIRVSTDSALGFNESKIEQYIAVYPTITNNNVIVKINFTSKANMKIYDIFGRLISTQALLPLSENLISLSEYNAGIYNASIIIDNKTVTNKIIITK